MTMVSDLSQDLVEEILSLAPITSLRAVSSTCRRWNSLSKDPSFTKKHCYKAAKETQVIMLYDFIPYLMRINLQDKDCLVDLPIKPIGKFKIEISNVFHSDGLLLCVTKKSNRLVVWNPYLRQTRLIKPKNTVNDLDRYGIGHDNNNNHKILMFSDYYKKGRRNIEYEIYHFKSDSLRALSVALDWRIPDPRREYIPRHREGLSLKGNIYFVGQKKLGVGQLQFENVLLGFDFTSESFGLPLPLPFQSYHRNDSVLLSAVREEKLAVLFKRWGAYEIKIWITTNIEPNAVSWSNFLNVDMTQFNGIEKSLYGTFFVDEEKKVAVICDRDRIKRTKYKARVIGENGYYKEVNLGESNHQPLMCSYVPSLVQIQQRLHTIGKRKERVY